VGTPNNIHKLISGEELGHLSLVQMAKLTYLFALILVSGLLLSQDFTAQIEGYVVRADTKEPIADANVYLLNTEIGAASDSSGFFSHRRCAIRVAGGRRFCAQLQGAE
jgi:hypothetical protein